MALNIYEGLSCKSYIFNTYIVSDIYVLFGHAAIFIIMLRGGGGVK